MKSVLLILVMSLLSTAAMAAICNEPTPTVTNIVGLSQTLARDVPVNTVIYTYEITGQEVKVVCSSFSSYNLSMSLTGRDASAEVHDNIHPTGIPGVGIRLLWYHPAHVPNPPAGGFYMGEFTTRPLGWGLQEFYVPHRFRLELIKTGPMMSGVSRNLEALIYYSNAKVHSVRFSNVKYSVINSSCKVTSNQLDQITLPDVKESAFTHQGVSAGTKEFQIGLLCDKGVKVAYRIDGLTTNFQVLPNSLGPGMAEGVGIQLMQGDSGSNVVQLLGTRTDFKTVPTAMDNEVLSIPLAARYLQTADKVKAGKVVASAAVTFFYE